MTPSEELYQVLKSAGIDFIISVPCKLLGELIEIAAADDSITYTPVTREEEGIGIMAGAYMAGKKPAILMQNSGFGNSANAILSLLNYYQIPVIFIISHRGSEGEPIEAQYQMGSAIIDLMKTCQVSACEITGVSELDRVKTGIDKAFENKKSAGFLFPFRYWEER